MLQLSNVYCKSNRMSESSKESHEPFFERNEESDGIDNLDFVDVEFLDQKSPSSEDVTRSSHENEASGDTQEDDVIGTTSRETTEDRSRMNITTQHLADPVRSVNIFGASVSDILKCLWANVEHYISREVVVDTVDSEKQIKWSSKDSPDVTDLSKFVLLKHGKTKKMYTVNELQDNSKLLTSWRGKEIQVHIFKYSTSVTSHSLWEAVNKQLLHPGEKDRAGAPSSEELFDCVNQLKEKHSHYTALWASWEKWANFILAQPADHRDQPGSYLTAAEQRQRT
ncbi:hypothetical protein RP20_CCG022925 [Aedes albopictus]|nr:hypothetical protein RP20_CCG022925 [Aedes albopictus]